MNNAELEQIIEGILFWKGEPMTRAKLAELTKTTVSDVEVSLAHLAETLSARGITLQQNGDEVMLRTSKIVSGIIEEMTRDELSKELSKATLETLSIVLYMSPVRRSTIDYIRGVNSQFSLRHLETRGLVEKISDEKDSRIYLYKPTFDALSFLGVSKIEDLPGYTDTKSKIEEFYRQKEESNQTKDGNHVEETQ